jgi:hypothetical protein
VDSFYMLEAALTMALESRSLETMQRGRMWCRHAARDAIDPYLVGLFHEFEGQFEGIIRAGLQWGWLKA